MMDRKLDKFVRKSLANKVPVFVNIGNGGVKSGYIRSEDPVKGFLIIGSGKNKTYTTFNDITQKASMDAGRVYIQPRTEWNATKIIEELTSEQ